jgi:ribosomal protein S18 acetylase RimI-like enzyme
MKIEVGTRSDRDKVVVIWDRVGLTRPWNDSYREFDAALENTQQTVLVARQDNHVVGAVMVADDGRSGWIYLLAVDPKYENQGVGSSLMSAGEDWLKNRGQGNAFVLVRNENEKVVPFYECLDYEERPVRVFRKSL